MLMHAKAPGRLKVNCMQKDQVSCHASQRGSDLSFIDLQAPTQERGWMNTHDLPTGIKVEILRQGDGVVRETFTEYGRTVHFAHGTPYSIRVTNETKKHASLKLTIDGRQTKLTTILLYCARGRRGRNTRVIKGFDLTRESTELPNDEFEITSTYEPFVARLTQALPGSAATDNQIGTIRFEFFATRYAKRQPGKIRQLMAKHPPQAQQNARRGVMATTGSGYGATNWQGKHYKGEERSGRRPVADLGQLLDPAIPSYEITICELH